MDERGFKPEEPGTMAVPGSINLWCPRADSTPRGEIGDAGVDGPNPALRPEEPGTVVVPGSANLWCPRADSNRRHPL